MLWRLGSNGDIQQLLEAGTADESASPVALFHRGVRLLSERSYLAAAEAFSQAAQAPALSTSAGGASVADNAFALHVFALCMAGRVEEAQEATKAPFAAFLEAQGQSVASVTDASLPPFWRWMKGMFGLDPERL